VSRKIPGKIQEIYLFFTCQAKSHVLKKFQELDFKKSQKKLLLNWQYEQSKQTAKTAGTVWVGF
jgi:hypothetical protein